MSLSRLEKNLLMFLDPFCSLGSTPWQIVKPHERRPQITQQHSGSIIFRFPRKNIAGYLLCSAAAWIWERRYAKKVRRVLYLQNGLLSSFHDLHAAPAYRVFVERHLPPLQRLRRLLFKAISPFWLADHRFIVIENGKPAHTPDDALPDRIDFMFYTNSRGKLMLTNAQTVISGNGKIYKTAATPDYAENLHHEHQIVAGLDRTMAVKAALAGPTQVHYSSTNCFYSEDYLSGDNLRELLRSFGKRNLARQTCAILDRLDAWFSQYRSAFTGPKQPISTLLAPILQLFTGTYGTADTGRSQLRHARLLITELDRQHTGLVPITAHNDLWPGNIIIRDMQPTVIDWERATEKSSPVFDYFWMIISSGMEYLVGKTGNQDYSHAFRQLLSGNDPVSRHTWHCIERFLDSLGYPETRPQFTLLFLLEWSIQGQKSLGRTTAMDHLAYAELVAFAATGFKRHRTA